MTSSSTSSDINVSAVSAHADLTPTSLHQSDFQPYDAKRDFVKVAAFQEMCLAAQKYFNGTRICVCKNMLLHQMDIYAEFCAYGVELVEHVNDPNIWDAYVRKVLGDGRAVMDISWQLGNYTEAISEYFPHIAGGVGGQEVFRVPNADGPPTRRSAGPDCALLMDIDESTTVLFVEIEVHKRDPLELSKHVVQLLQAINTLRSAIGVKVYPRTGNGDGGPFAAVCFVWKKRPDNTIYVDRVFDFGTRPSTMRSIPNIAAHWTAQNVDFTNVQPQGPNDAAPFQVERVPTPIPTRDGNNILPRRLAANHALRRHCTVTITIADIYGDMAFDNIAQEHHQNLEIDMYEVLRKIDTFKAKNFGVEAPPVQP